VLIANDITCHLTNVFQRVTGIQRSQPMTDRINLLIVLMKKPNGIASPRGGAAYY